MAHFIILNDKLKYVDDVLAARLAEYAKLIQYFFCILQYGVELGRFGVCGDFIKCPHTLKSTLERINHLLHPQFLIHPFNDIHDFNDVDRLIDKKFNTTVICL